MRLPVPATLSMGLLGKTPEPIIPPTPAESPGGNETPASELLQAGCKNCSTPPPRAPANFPLDGSGSGCGCGSGGNCVPGGKNCAPCEANTRIGRFLCGVYECICCPDPCYDPHWFPLADAAFFVDSVRPQTQQRFRWDAGLHLIDPDRAEYFWPRADGNGRGPRIGAQNGAAVPLRAETRLSYNELSLYTEGATGNLGVFADMPYRSFDAQQFGHAAGFGNVGLGTKTLLFDCELLQLGFMFRTELPSANATKGLGNGHLTLEPSLLIGIKLTPDSYFQGQIGEWIPIGGDPDYSGSILHYHFSVNHTLCEIVPDVPLISTLELNGWTIQHGRLTDPVFGTERASGETILTAGPGLRLFICDKIDFGIGTAFSLTSARWAEQTYRSEFRIRF